MASWHHSSTPSVCDTLTSSRLIASTVIDLDGSEWKHLCLVFLFLIRSTRYFTFPFDGRPHSPWREANCAIAGWMVRPRARRRSGRKWRHWHKETDQEMFVVKLCTPYAQRHWSSSWQCGQGRESRQWTEVEKWSPSSPPILKAEALMVISQRNPNSWRE